jgi:multimeric flavodoxin WrbA
LSDKQPTKIIAVYGSPRRNGNTATLLKQAVEGAREAGATVDEIVLRDLKLSPCFEIYGCKQAGECRIQDDFQRTRDMVLAARGMMLASPIFFYSVTAHTKMFMDRFQSLWVKKYWLENEAQRQVPVPRKGLFISVGATRGKKLFDGTLLTVRYFFDVIDMALWKSLLYRQLDAAEDVLRHPEYLEQARSAGGDLVRALSEVESV